VGVRQKWQKSEVLAGW